MQKLKCGYALADDAERSVELAVCILNHHEKRCPAWTLFASGIVKTQTHRLFLLGCDCKYMYPY